MDDAFLRRRSNDAADEGHEEDWNRFEALEPAPFASVISDPNSTFVKQPSIKSIKKSSTNLTSESDEEEYYASGAVSSASSLPSSSSAPSMKKSTIKSIKQSTISSAASSSSTAVTAAATLPVAKIREADVLDNASATFSQVVFQIFRILSEQA